MNEQNCVQKEGVGALELRFILGMGLLDCDLYRLGKIGASQDGLSVSGWDEG